MTISFTSIVLAFAVANLAIATVKGPNAKAWFWHYFPGGMLLWAISLFVNVH